MKHVVLVYRPGEGSNDAASLLLSLRALHSPGINPTDFINVKAVPPTLNTGTLM